MAIKHIQPRGLFTAKGMSHVVVSEGRLAHIAGQGAYDEHFTLIGAGDYVAQTIQAYQNLRQALAAVGARPEQVVSSTIYLVGLNAQVTEQFVSAMNQALDGKPFPAHASTLVGVSQLAYPDMLVEISAVAALD
ncbi:RidA family protein [Parahaliea mediterranea]|uniref:RidA family protein n=1 Tax=Parahaliea mediterranea TaxID=651086 RepID=UPI000E2ECB52|nr:RidA family protein [Parahaliea mediterranea]